MGAQRLRHACVQLPKLLELVGLGYTAWFVYRYLLFKVSRGAWRLLNLTVNSAHVTCKGLQAACADKAAWPGRRSTGVMVSA